MATLTQKPDLTTHVHWHASYRPSQHIVVAKSDHSYQALRKKIPLFITTTSIGSCREKVVQSLTPLNDREHRAKPMIYGNHHTFLGACASLIQTGGILFKNYCKHIHSCISAFYQSCAPLCERKKKKLKKKTLVFALMLRLAPRLPRTA